MNLSSVPWSPEAISIDRFRELSERVARGAAFMERFCKSSGWALAVDSPLFSIEEIEIRSYSVNAIQTPFSLASVHLQQYGKELSDYHESFIYAAPVHFGLALETSGRQRERDIRLLALLWRAYARSAYQS